MARVHGVCRCWDPLDPHRLDPAVPLQAKEHYHQVGVHQAGENHRAKGKGLRGESYPAHWQNIVGNLNVSKKSWPSEQLVFK